MEVHMRFTRLPSIVVCAATLLVVVFVLVTALRDAAFAQLAADGGDIKDRIAIQEKLLYAYAYAWDSKDCVSWANLFTTDALLDNGAQKVMGRNAILQWCIARQKDVVGNIKARHNMTNIVFDQLTSDHAQTRTYLILTWQKPGDLVPSMQDALTYRDVIVKQEGRWLFKERHFVR
jgi:hypothetical protein